MSYDCHNVFPFDVKSVNACSSKKKKLSMVVHTGQVAIVNDDYLQTRINEHLEQRFQLHTSINDTLKLKTPFLTHILFRFR